jgi:peptidyl-prolyl cis-trans isomerase SurA
MVWNCLGHVTMWWTAVAFLYAPFAYGEIIDRVVAVVNREVITYSELEKKLQLQAPPGSAQPSMMDYRGVVEEMVNQKLIDQETRQMQIRVKEKEVDEFLEKFAKRNKLTVPELRAAVEGKGLTWESYRTEVRNEIRRNDAISQKVQGQVNITDREVQEYYQANKEQYFAPARVKIEKLFFAFLGDVTPEGKAELARKAGEALERLKSGESFQQVAEAYGESGGGAPSDLGYLGKGELIGPLNEAAFTLPVGALSNVIATEKGYGIIRVVDRQEESTKGLEEVRQDIDNQLFRIKIEKKYQEWMQELRDRAYVEIKI